MVLTQSQAIKSLIKSIKKEDIIYIYIHVIISLIVCPYQLSVLAYLMIAGRKGYTELQKQNKIIPLSADNTYNINKVILSKTKANIYWRNLSLQYFLFFKKFCSSSVLKYKQYI